MFKEKLKKLPSKIFYILFALVVSIALWLYVEITEDAEQRHEVTNIPIVFRNEDVLRDRGWIPTILTENLSLTFEGSRAVISQLAVSGAVTVDVNLADVTRTGVVQLSYRILWPARVNPNNVNVAMRSEALITLLIDQVLERQIPVAVPLYTGGTAYPDLVAETVEFEPMFITVRGPEEVVSRINSAYVPILRENLSSTITEDMEFHLINDYDEQIEDALLESLDLSHDTIRITIPIRELMHVPLTVTKQHGSTTSESNIQVITNPSHVLVSGEPSVIAELNSFHLGTIVMTSFGVSTTVEFPIFIPEGIRNISGETAATVYVEVQGLVITHISTSNLHVINTPPGLEATILTQSLLIPMRGESEDLALVNPENIRIVADISELSPGTSTVATRIYLDGIDVPVDPIGSHPLVVRVVEPEPETETEP